MNPRPRALVADDDVAIRVLVSRILKRDGFDVDAVPDGAAAIEHVLQHKYVVIVLDLMMPRVDGFKVIEYMESATPEMLKRVIVMTAFGSTGMDRIPETIDRIEKPFEVSRLAQKAKALLEESNRESEPETPTSSKSATMGEDGVECEKF